MNKRTWWRVFGRPNRRDTPPQPDLIAGDVMAKFAELKRLCDGPCPPMTDARSGGSSGGRGCGRRSGTGGRGSEVRTGVKGLLVWGYCWGLVPAWAVRAAFRLFRLQGA